MKSKMPLKNIMHIKSLLTDYKKNTISRIKNLLFLVKVEGESAWPDLTPGKSYIATSIAAPKLNDFVIFKNPANLREYYVKKVIRKYKDNYFVAGNISGANSSREFGLIDQKLILGKIIKK